jgi:alkylation response protein AidB-like acyl-CoA dehydrogenase
MIAPAPRSEPIDLSTTERARAIIPQLSAQSQANEEAQRLTPETMQLLADAGLLGLFVPKVFGGSEVWPVEMMETIETLAYADASTAWVVMATLLATGSAAAYLPAPAAKHIFSERIPLMAGQGGAIGRGTVEPGGYRLNGRWSYGSGLLHSEWLHTGGAIQVDGETRRFPGTDRPDNRIFILPIDQVELKGNWDVLGLRATGSVDYAVTDTFVPEEFTHEFIANVPNHGGDLYRLGIIGVGIFLHGAFAIGVAKRVIEEIRQFAMSGKRSANFIKQGGGETFQEEFGRAVASYHAARSGLMRFVEIAESRVSKAENLTRRELTESVLAVVHANQAATDIANFGYYWEGGASLRYGVMQRLMRDITASHSHFLVSRNVQRESAKEVLGLYDGKPWSLVGYA